MSSADFTICTPGTGTLSDTVSSPLWQIQRIFCSQCHSQFSNFSFHLVPITGGWAEAVWNEKFARHFYIWPAVGIEPQTFWSWVQHFIQLATCSHCDIPSTDSYTFFLMNQILNKVKTLYSWFPRKVLLKNLSHVSMVCNALSNRPNFFFSNLHYLSNLTQWIFILCYDLELLKI